MSHYDSHPSPLVKLLWGLAHLGLDPGAAWLGLASAAVLAQRPRMTAWQAAATVHAFALIGYKVSPRGVWRFPKNEVRVESGLPF